MAITKVSRNLLNTGVSDSSDATAITITSDEKVGIGTTSPSYTLTVKSSSENHLRLENGSELGVFILNSDGDIKIWAHGADERIQFLNGVGSGTSIAAFDSHGLKFGSDTAAANALDDYEEGTWTPTVSSGTITLASNASEYTKIGDMVFAQTRITGFSGGTSGSQFVLGGFPYTVGTDQSHIGTAWGNFDSGGKVTMFFYIGGGAYFGGTSYDFVNYGDLGSSTNVIISLIYRHG